MRVGVDLDGVVYDFVEAYTKFARLLHPDEELPAPNTWNFFTDQWGWTTEEYLRVFAAGVMEGNVFWRGRLIGTAFNSLLELKELGHELIVVTHRTHPDRRVANAMVRATLYWLQHINLPVDGILFEGVKTNIGIDVLVDDAPHNIQAAWDADETVIVFDQPWNEKVTLPTMRAGSWDDVVSCVQLIETLERANARV